ncbi:MAG: cobalt ECF transporter T component CbiQ [Actinomycetia bacterium]|nr:cobalt ECF transporter T component CbiQ [Actinomycetes bacterium]
MHDLPAKVKLVVALATVFLIVLTPPEAMWAFFVYFALLVTVLAMANIKMVRVLPRFIVEVPFVVFAVLMPFIGQGPRLEVGPVLLSEAGLWSAWGLLAKATLGLFVSIILAATTTMSDLVEGLHQLKFPSLIVAILTSMIRYVNVVTDEAARMSRARAARGFSGKGPRSWPILAHSLGTLFIRSYERGERVHIAMLSRGYTGELPQLGQGRTVAPATWAAAALLPALVLTVCLTAVLTQ